MWSVVVRALNGLMAFLYIGIGGFLIFSKKIESLPSNIKPLIGAVLLVYGVFRFYRVLEQDNANHITINDNEIDEDE